MRLRAAFARDQLTIHADRGSPMTAKSTALLYVDLGIARVTTAEFQNIQAENEMTNTRSRMTNDMLARARRWHMQPASILLPSEVRMIETARRALRAVSHASSNQLLFDILRTCFPFDACLLETIYASHLREPVEVIHSVPDDFSVRRSRVIGQDPAIPFVTNLDAGIAFIDTEVIPERALHAMPYWEEVYTGSGFGGVSGLIISAEDVQPPIRNTYNDRRYVSLFLFRGRGERKPTLRECRMLELLHEDINEAVTRMYFPILSGYLVDLRFSEEDEDGYVLLRADGSIVQATLRAFTLSYSYVPRGKGPSWRHRSDCLMPLIEHVRRMSEYSCTGKYLWRSDRRAVLQVRMHHLPRETGRFRGEELTIAKMTEIQLNPKPMTEVGEVLLETLTTRVQEVVRLCVTTDLTAKEIAEMLGTSVRTVEKQKESAFRALRVASVAELRQRLTTR